MSATHFKICLADLDITPRDFADFLDLGDRTVRHYTYEGCSSGPVIMLLYLMDKYGITPDDLDEAKQWLDDALEKRRCPTRSK